MWYIYLCLFAAFSYADNHQLLQAAQLYQQQAYDQALQKYEQIVPKTASVYYNMGHAAYQLRNYTQAYLYWLRAQYHGNAKVFALSNRSLSLLADEGIGAYSNKLYLWLWWLILFIGISLWQFGCIFLWCITFYMFYKNMKKRAYLCFGICILLLVPVMIAYHAYMPRGMIIQDAPLYNGPNSAYYQLATIKEGIIVKVHETKDHWLKIASDEHIGWVQQDRVTSI